MTYQAMTVDPRSHPHAPWRGLFRVEANSGLVSDVSRGLEAIQPERAVYAEGDSWFDKFTPIGVRGTNLLDALRAPFLTAVVDVAHIGDEIHEMVSGRQERQTRTLMRFFRFDAILLSAGGNDLRALFEREFVERTRPWTKPEVMELVHRSRHRDFFLPVIQDIGRFFDLRDDSRSTAARPSCCMATTTCSRGRPGRRCSPAPAWARARGCTRCCAGPTWTPSRCGQWPMP
jgi:hypothetical protein